MPDPTLRLPRRFVRLGPWRRESEARNGGDGAAAERRACEFYGVENLDGFGAFARAEIAAPALALAYVKRTQFEARPTLLAATRRGTSLEIDLASAPGSSSASAG